MKVASIRHFHTDIGTAGANVPIREKAHPGISPAGAAKNAARGKIMKILAIEASGQVCGTAVLEDDTLVADYNILYKKTHSQSLVPMMDEVKRMIDLDLETVDAIAVTKGPGSFTGIRIGAATAKGLALALNRPIIPVPTVESIAWNLCGTGREQVICPIMDARRSQVYTGVYESSAEPFAVCGKSCGNGSGPVSQNGDDSESAVTGGSGAASENNDDSEKAVTCGSGNGKDATGNCVKNQCAAAGCSRQTAWQMLTLKDQCVISIEEICAILNCIGSSVIFLGDGVPVYREKIVGLMRVPYSFAPAHLSKQRAGSTAALAMQFWREKGDACLVNADDFRPDYLRLSQAERDRAAGVDTSRTVHRD